MQDIKKPPFTQREGGRSRALMLRLFGAEKDGELEDITLRLDGGDAVVLFSDLLDGTQAEAVAAALFGGHRHAVHHIERCLEEILHILMFL